MKKGSKLVSRDPVVRFWANVEKKGPIHPKCGRCWVWKLSKTSDGYGQFFVLGESKAHRVSFIIANGDIPEGLQVLHHCDNRSCVNPSHLFLGTHEDNMRDMVSKNRQATGDRTGVRLRPETRPRGKSHWANKYPEKVTRGVKNGMSKLNEEQVKLIRRLHIEGRAIASLAREFGMGESSISSIVKNQTWKHVKD